MTSPIVPSPPVLTVDEMRQAHVFINCALDDMRSLRKHVRPELRDQVDSVATLLDKLYLEVAGIE